MWRAIHRLRNAKRGAVAPTVALSLFALIGMGGVAFDYAHLADLDTELQNAADQAALAAATQLDGGNNARARATAAAQSLLNNTTYFASDAGTDGSDPRKVTIANVVFYQSYDEATDVYGDPATNDANARVVRVHVGGRRADYALTPVVGAFTSGTIDAEALASLASAVCNVPPLMMCTPAGTDFPTAADIGRGVLLQPGPVVGFWAPGDYGYLDFGDGASGVKINLGRNNEQGGCIDMSNGIPTEPGNKASVTDALNSRFDLYPAASSNCNAGTGDYCPSENTHKDLAKTYEVEVKNWDEPGPGVTPPSNPVIAGTEQCGAAGQKLINTSNQTDQGGLSLPAASAEPPPGMPRDTCHYPSESCSGAKFGDGAWNRNAYLGPTHGTDATTLASSLGKTPATLTRWDVYKWELADPSRRAPKAIDVTPNPIPFKEQGNSGKGTYTFTNRCTFPQPVNGTGVPSSTSQKDRRVLTVAAVDCTGLNGKSDVIVKQWVDVFLVEPSLSRSTPQSPYATSKEQIYVEIIGIAKRPNGQSAFQYYLRQRPRLLR
jgi:Flp pilus assembly protein TadG